MIRNAKLRIAPYFITCIAIACGGPDGEFYENELDESDAALLTPLVPVEGVLADTAPPPAPLPLPPPPKQDPKVRVAEVTIVNQRMTSVDYEYEGPTLSFRGKVPALKPGSLVIQDRVVFGDLTKVLKITVGGVVEVYVPNIVGYDARGFAKVHVTVAR